MRLTYRWLYMEPSIRKVVVATGAVTTLAGSAGMSGSTGSAADHVYSLPPALALR